MGCEGYSRARANQPVRESALRPILSQEDTYSWVNTKPEFGEYTKSLFRSATARTGTESPQPPECIHDHEDDLIKGSTSHIVGCEGSLARQEGFVREEACCEDQNGYWY